MKARIAAETAEAQAPVDADKQADCDSSPQHVSAKQSSKKRPVLSDSDSQDSDASQNAHGFDAAAAESAGKAKPVTSKSAKKGAHSCFRHTLQ